MKFTYKKGFWIVLILSLVLAIYQFGKIISLDVDLDFKKLHIAFLKSDARTIGELTKRQLYTRIDIEDFLDKKYPSDGVRKDGDTLFLDSSYLLFKNDSLTSIIVN